MFCCWAILKLKVKPKISHRVWDWLVHHLEIVDSVIKKIKSFKIGYNCNYQWLDIVTSKAVLCYNAGRVSWSHCLVWFCIIFLQHWVPSSWLAVDHCQPPVGHVSWKDCTQFAKFTHFFDCKQIFWLKLPSTNIKLDWFFCEGWNFIKSLNKIKNCVHVYVCLRKVCNEP